MKRMLELSKTSPYTDDRRPKQARCTLATPPLTGGAWGASGGEKRMKEIVCRVGKQASYNLDEEFQNLFELSIKNRQILVEASEDNGPWFTEMQLVACVSVAAKMDVNFDFNIEKACLCHVNDWRLNEFVNAELTIALKAPPLRRRAMRIIKDSKKYWDELKK